MSIHWVAHWDIMVLTQAGKVLFRACGLHWLGGESPRDEGDLY